MFCVDVCNLRLLNNHVKHYLTILLNNLTLKKYLQFNI